MFNTVYTSSFSVISQNNEYMIDYIQDPCYFRIIINDEYFMIPPQKNL